MGWQCSIFNNINFGFMLYFFPLFMVLFRIIFCNVIFRENNCFFLHEIGFDSGYWNEYPYLCSVLAYFFFPRVFWPFGYSRPPITCFSWKLMWFYQFVQENYLDPVFYYPYCKHCWIKIRIPDRFFNKYYLAVPNTPTMTHKITKLCF